jgi:tRNA threonylcarbamoyladenosine modification (KEOPS) complex  Pcc1 subunit
MTTTNSSSNTTTTTIIDNDNSDLSSDEGQSTKKDNSTNKRLKQQDIEQLYPHQALIHVPFATAKAARYVATALNVDKEISPDKVWREITILPTNDKIVLFEVRATDVRMLKAALLSLFDMTATCIRILCEFDTLALE